MKDGLYTRHEVACIIADLFGGTCACDHSGNDEWLPHYCEFADNVCPLSKHWKSRHQRNRLIISSESGLNALLVEGLLLHIMLAKGIIANVDRL